MSKIFVILYFVIRNHSSNIRISLFNGILLAIRFTVALPLLLTNSCANNETRDEKPEPEKRVGLNISLWEEIESLKSRYEPGLMGAPDDVVEQYRILLARYYNLDEDAYIDDFSRSLSGNVQLASVLSPDQIEAWRELQEMSRGRLDISWNIPYRTPDYIDFGIQIHGDNSLAAIDDLEVRVGPILNRIFHILPDDELVLVSDEIFETDDGNGGGDLASVHEFQYQRYYAGLPVFGDWYSVTIRTSDWNRDAWVAFVSAHWVRDVETAFLEPLLDEFQAATIAVTAGDVPAGWSLHPPLLGVSSASGEPELAYEVFIGNADGATWLYYVSALRGEILWGSNQVPSYDGSLKIYVGRPHEGNGKYARALPDASIYEDYKRYYGITAGCNGQTTMDQWAGDTDRVLGSTNYSGNYSGLTGIDPGDTTWTVDLRGTYLKDVGKQSILDFGSFTAGGSYTLPQQTIYQRSRRGEVYYLANYGHRFYQYGAYNTPQYAQLGFEYIEAGPPGWPYSCVSPVADGCCGGSAPGTCFDITCGTDMGSSTTSLSERKFRGAIFHEQNHTLRHKASGWYCMNCTGTSSSDGAECGLWEEGRAMWAHIALGQFEDAWSSYRPDKKYPDDFGCTDYYYYGAIFPAIYAHYLLHAGAGPATKDIHYNLNNVDASTRMVGSCTDSDGDGYVEVTECPSNSTYRHLITANAFYWLGKYERPNEISEVFHWHVTDADRGTAGAQTFPWADEMPNNYDTPPFLAAEFGVATLVTEGPSPGSGLLRLETENDYDTIMFLGKDDESYYINTTNYQVGMDTYMEILDGFENVLAYNDDCGSNPYSCITFSPSTTDYYRVRVKPVAGSATGPDKSYWLRVAIQNDDYGDLMSGAAALVTDGVWRTATFNSTDDVDLFRIVSSGNQTLSFLGCSDAGISTQVLVLNSSGGLVDYVTNTSCSSPSDTVSIYAGVYFLKCLATTGATGSYKVKASLAADIDVDSTPANAWQLTDDAQTGRLLGTRFETLSDEDWFKFSSPQAGRRVIVETWGLASNVDTEIEVYAPSDTVFGRTGEPDSLPDTSGGKGLGHWMLKDDDGAISIRGSRLAFITPMAGTYYVRVRNIGSVAGNYYVMYEDTGLNSGWISYP